MKLLAFDTSTEALSIAVCDGAKLWARDGAGGAQASTHLIQMLLALLGEAGLRLAALDAIVFGRGPGSFTGLRTACAVAQGLAFGAARPLLPVDTLLAVAEDARQRHGTARVHAMLDARMGEIYLGDYEHDGARWVQHGDIRLIRPQDFVQWPGWTLAGNLFEPGGDALMLGLPQGSCCVPALPTAAALLRLAPGLLAFGAAVAPEQALPLYIRDKVAKTSDERAVERAARNAADRSAEPLAGAPSR